MNVADDHSRWDEDVAAYAIGALDAHDAVSFAAHLADCDRCRGELHRLAPAVELLPASVEQFDPPPALRGRIMAAIAEESPIATPAGAPNRRTSRERERSSLLSRVRGWRIPVLPAGLTAAGLAAAFAIGMLVNGGDSSSTPQRTTVPVTASAPGADLRAQLVSDGSGGWQLDVDRLPQPRAGRVYQAWVMRKASGSIEPSTVFVLARDGTSAVAIPQSLRDGDQVLVTQEPSGGSRAPTARPLLSATV